MTRPLVLAALALGLGGCVNPMHLSYDYGRSFKAAFQTQPDLSRPTVASSQHPLAGMEGVQIRLRTREATTKEQTEMSTLNAGTN